MIVLILQLIPTTTRPFSFKTITNWAFALNEESSYREYCFKPGGTLSINHKSKGSVTIKSWTRPMLVIKSIVRFKEKEEKPTLNFTITDQLGTVQSHTPPNSKATIDLEFMVPEKINIVIESDGSVKMKAIDGTVDVCAVDSVDIRHIGRSVSVQTEGNCTVRMHTVPLTSSVKIACKGSLNLAIPPDAHAYLTAKTEHGLIFCDHFFTFKPFAMKLTKASWEKLRKNITGTIGNGGAHIDLSSVHGPITIGNSRE
jgi:hypothetical protein